MGQRLHKNAFTGCFDRHRNPIYEGQCIRHNNARHGTKPEFRYPIFRVVFDPPSFTLKHVGGGKDGGAHDFILRCGGGNKCIEIVPFPHSILVTTCHKITNGENQ